MDKHEHAAALKAAVESSPHSRQAIADYVGRNVRTLTNWTSDNKPMMPDAGDRTKLRELLGPYDAPGDPVERAIRTSSLRQWRQLDVLATYQRHLEEQEREQAG